MKLIKDKRAYISPQLSKFLNFVFIIPLWCWILLIALGLGIFLGFKIDGLIKLIIGGEA